MQIRLLTSMSGDRESYQFGEIVETERFVRRDAGGKLLGLDAEGIGKAWIEAGIAEKPKTEQVLEANVAAAERVAAEATAEAASAVAERIEIARKRDELAAQVETLTEAAGDGADHAKEVGRLRAEVVNLQKQLQERETQLGGGQFARFSADADAMANKLATARTGLDAVIAPTSQ